jgi:thiosulfate/3-mercaptopyruvate sulfurtransferase
LVDLYSIHSTYLKKIGNIFRHESFHPRRYEIVRIALTTLNPDSHLGNGIIAGECIHIKLERRDFMKKWEENFYIKLRRGGDFIKKRIVLAALLSVFTLTACAGIGTSPKGLETPIEKASMTLVTDVKSGGYQLIGAEALNKWLTDKKNVILIDTMPKEDFDKTRIKGAVNSPVPKAETELTPNDKKTILTVAGGDKGKAIVVYCGFTACRRSHWGAKILVENGYKSVYRFPGGIIGWLEYGYPAEGK